MWNWRAPARLAAVALLGTLLGVYDALAQKLPDVPLWAEIALLGGLIIPLTFAMVWLALPFWRSPYVPPAALALAGLAVVLEVVELDIAANYVKFAAVSPGADAPARFARLLDAVEGYAAAHGAGRLVAGVNTARREAYSAMLDRGYRPFAYGVAMHRPDEPAYDRAGVYALDDRR